MCRGTSGLSAERWNCYDNEKPRHQVTVSHTLEVMTTEVTQGLYESVMGSNPSKFKIVTDQWRK